MSEVVTRFFRMFKLFKEYPWAPRLTPLEDAEVVAAGCPFEIKGSKPILVFEIMRVEDPNISSASIVSSLSIEGTRNTSPEPSRTNWPNAFQFWSCKHQNIGA